MKIDVSKEELELIKEALTNSSVSYICKGTDKTNIELLGEKWSMKIIKKSNDMTDLINKLSS